MKSAADGMKYKENKMANEDNSSDHKLALPKGERLEEFEVHRILGEPGGFGITYLCWDHKLNIARAVKEYMPTALSWREGDQSVAPRSTKDAADFQWGLDRFLSEARDLARFDHPNIISVRRFFEAHGTAYIVMDYAEGETLSEKLEHEGTLKEAQLKEILLPLMDGLDEVHRSDLLHRDIKPGNIIIKDNGQPILIDFGAARQSTGARSRSMTAVLTPGYAPLEQYSTKGNQGAWTDIYALAAVAYRALTGSTPEEATNRVKNDPLIPAIEAGRGQASRTFLKALDWALAVDEEERPQTIAAFRAALGGEAAIQLNRKPAPGQKKQAKTTASFWQELPSFGLNKAAIIGVIALIALPALGYGYVQYRASDDVSWHSAQRVDTIEAYEDYLTSFQFGSYRDQANKALQRQVTAKKIRHAAAERRALVMAIQTELDRLDYVLEANGVLGAGTCARITAYQKAHYLSVNCTPSMELLDHLQQASAPEGLKRTERRAQWGDAAEQNRLGVRYHFGNGVAKDDAKALEWFRKSVNQGYAAGQRNLGNAYRNGWGVTKDYAKAVEWYRKSAKQGYAGGQFWLGIMYHEGEGVAKDFTKALEWFRKSAKQGDANGQHWLGYMYYRGNGVAKDFTKALEWFRKSAKQGNVASQDYLGDMYYKGEGVAKNRSIACDWWRKSAAQNYSFAKKSLKKHCS